MDSRKDLVIGLLIHESIHIVSISASSKLKELNNINE